jgi:hypothetical protein
MHRIFICTILFYNRFRQRESYARILACHWTVRVPSERSVRIFRLPGPLMLVWSCKSCPPKDDWREKKGRKKTKRPKKKRFFIFRKCVGILMTLENELIINNMQHKALWHEWVTKEKKKWSSGFNRTCELDSLVRERSGWSTYVKVLVVFISWHVCKCVHMREHRVHACCACEYCPPSSALSSKTWCLMSIQFSPASTSLPACIPACMHLCGSLFLYLSPLSDSQSLVFFLFALCSLCFCLM